MAAWRRRIGRMGNHYANKARLNHAVPIIICWDEPRLPGSLVCSTAGTPFLFFFSHSIPFSAIPSLPCLSTFPLSSVCDLGFYDHRGGCWTNI